MTSGPRFPDCELVIFDCDGVLVDSEPLIYEAMAELSSGFGWACTVEEAPARFRGLANEDIKSKIENEVGTTLDVDFQQLFEERVFKTFERDLLPLPGVLTVLNELRIPYCTATNAVRSEAEFKLRVTGLLPWFTDRVFTSDQVATPKPSPDLYLYAASQMHSRPEKTLVVEDSPIGIRSGFAAGMKVLGLAATSFADAQSLTDAGAEVVYDIRAILAAVG